MGGEDVESGSDAELAAVLENASGLVGRKGRAKRRKMDGEDSDECDPTFHGAQCPAVPAGSRTQRNSVHFIACKIAHFNYLA